MSSMFCFQCEQTAGGKGCTKSGVCGKKPEVAIKHDELTGALVGLARAAQGKSPGRKADELMMQGLFATITNVNFDGDRIDEFKRLVQEEKANWAALKIFARRPGGNTDTILARLSCSVCGMATYAWHAYVLGKTEDKSPWFYKGMRAIGKNTPSKNGWT